MSNSKLCLCETAGGLHYYVRETGLGLHVAGPWYKTEEEAREQLRKCELDPEYLYWQKYYAFGALPNPAEERRHMRNMSKYELMVLDYLFSVDGDYCVQTFKSLSEGLNITERQAKVACRQLKRRGYAEHSPYWSYDSNRVNGSGYTITREGIWEARRRASQATSKASGSVAEEQSAPSP